MRIAGVSETITLGETAKRLLGAFLEPLLVPHAYTINGQAGLNGERCDQGHWV